jgi:hypothetical protein
MERLRELVAALQLSDELPRLADLARVPVSKQEDFRELILSLLCDTWIRESRLRLTSKNLALSRAATELRSARQALADLDERDREALSRQISAVENGIDEFLLLAIGGFEVPRLREHRGGRRAGTVNNPRFQSFIQGMFIVVEASGGRLTIEKNIGKGTEPFRKPAVYRSEQFAGALRLALVTPEASKARCGAEFTGLVLLLACDGECAVKIRLCFRDVRLL